MKTILPPTYFLAAVVLIVAVHFLLPLGRLIVFPWLLVGLVPLAAGIVLNLLADRSFKRYGTTVKPFGKSSALVTHGAFDLSRNPMYLGMILILAGIAVLTGSAAPWLIVAATAILFDRVFIVPEQRMLEETFGVEFLEYKQRVRRWI